MVKLVELFIPNLKLTKNLIISIIPYFIHFSHYFYSYRKLVLLNQPFWLYFSLFDPPQVLWNKLQSWSLTCLKQILLLCTRPHKILTHLQVTQVVGADVILETHKLFEVRWQFRELEEVGVVELVESGVTGQTDIEVQLFDFE